MPSPAGPPGRRSPWLCKAHPDQRPGGSPRSLQYHHHPLIYVEALWALKLTGKTPFLSKPRVCDRYPSTALSLSLCRNPRVWSGWASHLIPSCSSACQDGKSRSMLLDYESTIIGEEPRMLAESQNLSYLQRAYSCEEHLIWDSKLSPQCSMNLEPNTTIAHARLSPALQAQNGLHAYTKNHHHRCHSCFAIHPGRSMRLASISGHAHAFARLLISDILTWGSLPRVARLPPIINALNAGEAPTIFSRLQHRQPLPRGAPSGDIS